MAEALVVFNYLKQHNPELAKRIANMQIYEGALEICREYGFALPAPEDQVAFSLNVLLDKLKQVHEPSNDEE